MFSQNNEIYVNHEYKGVFKIKVDPDFRKVISVSKVNTLEKGVFSSLTEYNAALYYATEHGVFKKKSSDSKFIKDTI